MEDELGVGLLVCGEEVAVVMGEQLGVEGSWGELVAGGLRQVVLEGYL